MRAAILVLLMGLTSIVPSPARCSQPASSAADTVVHPCADQVIPLSWEIRPEHPCWKDSITLVLRSCANCVDLQSASRPVPKHIIVRAVLAESCASDGSCSVDSLLVPLGAFRIGPWLALIETRGDVISSDGTLCSLVRYDTLRFEVGDCVPREGELPYVQQVRVEGFQRYCPDCPTKICPRAYFKVEISGAFPATRYRLLSIQRLPPLPPPGVGVAEEPAVVRLVVHDGLCDSPVWGGQYPFSATQVMSPVRSGTHELEVQVVKASCADSVGPGDPIYSVRFPFTVADRCTSTLGCLGLGFDHSQARDGCDAVVSPRQPGFIRLTVPAPVPLSTLEARLYFQTWDPPYRLAFRVANIQPIGPASGMSLKWEETDDGARFSMSAEHGAPIPAAVITDSGWSPAQPVVLVTVLAREGMQSRLTLLRTTEAVGMDSLASPVRECTFSGDWGIVAATLCTGSTGPGPVSLTAGQPNPFSSETRFTLGLSRAGEADVTVHDLSGRKVAVLQHGRLEAGGHAIVWNGTRADGSRAPQGIYFIRARAAGEASSIRVALLRRN